MFNFSATGAAGSVKFDAGLVTFAAGLIAYMFLSESASCKVMLYTHAEAEEVIATLKQVPEYNVKLLDVTHGASSGTQHSPESQAFANSKPRVSQDPEGKQPPDYDELGNFAHPYMQRITARKMAKLLAFLKFNGGYNLITTQELGNCLWASVLRGTDVKKEYTTMHLRRQVVKMIGAYPDFFFKYLQYNLASVYGQNRPTEEEVAAMEKEGSIKPQQAHDYRLPGPFTFTEFVEYLLKDGTWGDDHVLTLISLMWQIKITILNADTLGETHIRHDCRLSDAELVVVFIGGDHYMGTGKCRRFN